MEIGVYGACSEYIDTGLCNISRTDYYIGTLIFEDGKFKLPKLKEIPHKLEIARKPTEGELFTFPAMGLKEVRDERRATIQERCEVVAEVVNGTNDYAVVWCNLNDESKLLSELDSDAVEILGGMSIEKKEDILLSFAKGDIKRIITKAKMTSMGLNWQHCNHTVFFPTWSYEQYYQAIRRFCRFGQKREVTCDIVISDGQSRVIQALEEKTQKAIELYKNLVSHANQDFSNTVKEFDKNIKLPEFIL